MNKNDQKELAIPDNLDSETKALYAELKLALKESSSGLNPDRVLEISINNEDTGQVNSFIEELIIIGDSHKESGTSIPTGSTREKINAAVNEAFARKKPSPPPPPPMRKYKTSFFGFVDVLVNQDEIDAHRELMDKWREENLK